MEAVLDSVSLQHILRSLTTSRIRHKNNHYENIETALDRPLRERKLTLAVDKDGALIDEWSRTCGVDNIQVLIAHWESFAGLLPIDPVSKISLSISRQLRQLGFIDGIDRLILRISLKTEDRIVVSEDSDFWDPAHPRKRGDPNACVAKLCSESLSITVLLLGMLFAKLDGN